jgi:hypothetical protein
LEGKLTKSDKKMESIMQMTKLQQTFFETWEEEHRGFKVKVKDLQNNTKVLHQAMRQTLDDFAAQLQETSI